MQRTKVLAVLVAVASAGAAALVLSGSATAGEWHVYEGDVFPGHAYGLMVPAGAKGYEVVFAGNGSAHVALLDPQGVRIGSYALGPAMTSAVVLDPAEGRHVVYVYDLADGALTLRVNAEAAPALSLQELPLAREDLEIAKGDGGPLDKATTVTMRAQPVFLTLLYSGSVEKLDAAISSPKGEAVTIRGETGTAFSPGVWTALSGERATNADNLDGLTYEVRAKAARFEGAMTLTTLSVDLGAAPPAPPVPPAPPQPGAPPKAPVRPVAQAPAGVAEFAAEVGQAVEFDAKAGKLVLFDAADVHEDDEARSDYEDWSDLAVSIYAPDDTLLVYFRDSGYDLAVPVELPADGRYVAYVHHATGGAVVGRLAAGALGEVRPLALVVEEFSLYAGGGLFGGPSEFELARVPVSLKLEVDGGVETLSSVHVENEAGPVASRGSLLGFGGSGPTGWTDIYPENFRAGEHRLYADGILGGEIRLTSVSYLREAAPAPVEEVVEETPAEEEPAEEEPSEEESSEEHEGPLGLPF